MIINKFKFELFAILILIIAVFTSYVNSIPEFAVYGTTNQTTEDLSSPFFVFNVSSLVNVNTSDPDDSIITYTVRGINSSLYPTQTNVSFYSWITINSSNGNLTINATLDNQTGRFNISVLVENAADLGESRPFYFIVNATNDAVNITNIAGEYNLTQNQSFSGYLNGTDEESHYPLTFNVSFLNNCTLAQWSTRTNCTIFQAANVSNSSALMNFTPDRNDVGTYYANITAIDYGANYTCSSGYCETNYSRNRTTSYSSIVIFNVLSVIDINVSNCQNKYFQENQTGTCQINISSKSQNSTINVSSYAILRNYNGDVSNRSWFYPVNRTFSDNFSRTIFINVTSGKTEIGNWTINFTVMDLTNTENSTVQINVYVNRTINDVPDIIDISNRNSSISLNTTINITVYDDDMLVPDKNVSFGGYNETMNFTVNIMNTSNLSQQLSLNSFDIEILEMPVAGTNRTEARIQFIPNSSEYGNYTINISVNDNGSSNDFSIFNLSILNNLAPRWNTTVGTTFVFYEGNLTNINFSLNVSDPDGDSLTFSFANNTAFPSFSINSTTGIASFTLVDGDVGQHLVNITISDGYLTNSTEFNFTIYNVHDTVLIEKPIESGDITNGTVDSNSNINTSEDNVTIISLWIHDEDFKIPTIQKLAFYNETLTINLTIEGRNTSLFTFTRNTAFPTVGSNRSNYEATFKPNKSDVGSYNITINVSDNGGNNDFMRFNLSVLRILHNPVIMNLTNQSTSVNRTLYYRINATDAEDGDSMTAGNTNISYNYSFLNGSDFINNNQTIFNRTTGEINITFNSSDGNAYRLNISVNDTDGRLDSKTFWIFVYDPPSVNQPIDSYQFSLVENTSYNLTFNVNHSVLDNLSYVIYITSSSGNNILKLNSTSYGNGSNLSWEFRPNFTDEVTNGNLTLIAYTDNSNLTNRTDINVTKTWNISINHSNSPVSFSGTIGGADTVVEGTSPVSITLSDYFIDVDAFDARYNQTIGFIYNTSSTNGSVVISLTNLTNGSTPVITFSSSSTSSISGFITAQEFNSSNSSQLLNTVLSNNFTVNISVTTTSSPTSSGGGGGGGGSTSTKVIVAFKLIVPSKVSGYKNEKITIPLVLSNTGIKSFSGIDLTSYGFKDGNIYNKVRTVLDKNYVASLPQGAKENLTLTVYFDNNSLLGNYDIFINATSRNPIYNDWAKITINLQDINITDVEKFIIYTEELIVENPQCIELKEVVAEARKLFEKRDYLNARLKAEEAVDGCKKNILQTSIPKEKPDNLEIPLFFLISIAIALLSGIGYYYMKRFYFQINFSRKNS